ncbi:MAG: metal ABC transporter permease [Bacteroidota bacterium]
MSASSCIQSSDTLGKAIPRKAICRSMPAGVAFFSLSDPNVRYVVLGTLLMTSTGAIVGALALLKRKALLGDAIAHAIFPGICLTFMITGSHHPLPLTLGACITGALALQCVDSIITYTKLHEDTAIALVLSIAFGIGTLLLSIIQNSGQTAQAGLGNFLFGKAAALMAEDLSTLAILSCLVIVTFLAFAKVFALIAFDKTFAQCIGLPVRQLELVFSGLTVLAIVIGIRAIGIVLIAATLITPASAARYWTDRFGTLVCLSAILGLLAGLGGSYMSYIWPNMPTGPWVVICITFLAYGSFLLAPRQGLLARQLRRRQQRRKILAENILKVFYELGQQDQDFFCGRSVTTLTQHRAMSLRVLLRGLKHLQKRGLVVKKRDMWRLTTQGHHLGEAVSQRYQLWERYLREYLKIQPDHVHEDAESIEHVLTPTLVQELNQLLSQHERGHPQEVGLSQPVK